MTTIIPQPMMSPELRRHVVAEAPTDQLLTALEISHRLLDEPLRVVNDSARHTLIDHPPEEHEYQALAFGIQLAADRKGQAPQAQIVLDNVGQTATVWIDRAQGGAGGQVRVMQVLASRRVIEWEMTLDILSTTIESTTITVTLGFDPILGRDAVPIRFDPETAPGLF